MQTHLSEEMDARASPKPNRILVFYSQCPGFIFKQKAELKLGAYSVLKAELKQGAHSVVSHAGHETLSEAEVRVSG